MQAKHPWSHGALQACVKGPEAELIKEATLRDVPPFPANYIRRQSRGFPVLLLTRTIRECVFGNLYSSLLLVYVNCRVNKHTLDKQTKTRAGNSSTVNYAYCNCYCNEFRWQMLDGVYWSLFEDERELHSA